MYHPAMLLLAIATLVAAQEPKAPKAPPAPAPESITWARTWDEALRESTIRNVPILIYVSGDHG